jgi:hypothetical protein
MPFASIVIPTRNRPEFVRSALESLRSQTFEDFEVIVSDNHTGLPCRDVFDEFEDARFRYVTPHSPIPMHDNWEMACGLARGEFVGVVIDKTILKPSALQTLYDCAQSFSADLVSWRADSFVPEVPNSASSQGLYYSWSQPESPAHLFSGHEELRRRFSLDVRRGNEGEHYFWGKICFGAFHRGLLDRIRAATGRVFFPISPDYTSMLAALAMAERAVNAGRSCVIQNLTKLSNGWNIARHPERTRAFLAEIDASGAVIANLPIAGLYTSIHNIVMHDYLAMQRRLGSLFPDIELDRGNLALRAAEDLGAVVWDSPQLRAEQHELLNAAIADIRASERGRIIAEIARSARADRKARLRTSVREGLLAMPLGNSAVRLLRRGMAAVRDARTPQSYLSIIAAAKAADAEAVMPVHHRRESA